MLKCRDISILASDYVDGRLRWSKRLSVAMHLLMCPHCRRFMRNFRVVLLVLKGAPVAAPDPEQIERVEKRVLEHLHDHNRESSNHGE